MQRHRFYAPPDQIKANEVLLSADEAHHLSRVLRLAIGDEAFVFDGQGTEYRCHILTAGKDSVELEIVEAFRNERESPIHITLAQALAKGEKFDFIVQKATELGVSAITPLETDHADVKLKEERADKKLDRWRRISLESLKQCGRSRLVEINPPTTIARLVDSIKTDLRTSGLSRSAGSSVLLSQSGAGAFEYVVGEGGQGGPAILVFSEHGGVGIAEALEGDASRSGVMAMIGPEGGWSLGELTFLTGSGCTPVTLGPRILRTETAALVALTLIQHQIGDISRPNAIHDQVAGAGS